MPYYVYILLCKDGSYYTGYAKDIKHRVEQQKKGQGARYTRMRQAQKIVYVEEFNSRSEAMRRERKIKSLKHTEKQKLVNTYLNSHTNTQNSHTNTQNSHTNTQK